MHVLAARGYCSLSTTWVTCIAWVTLREVYLMDADQLGYSRIVDLANSDSLLHALH